MSQLFFYVFLLCFPVAIARFGFRINPSQPAVEALPPPEHSSKKQQKPLLAPAVLVPVTAQPLRPGEEDPLGLDINADRTNHRNSPGQENSRGLSVTNDLRARRPLDKARADIPQLRQSPERKQISNQYVLQLQYNDAPVDSEVHIQSAGAKAGGHAQLFQQRMNYNEEAIMRKVRPTSAAANGCRQLSQHDAGGGLREACGRPGTAGADRASSRHATAAVPADRNAERKHELLVKWGASGDDENALVGGGNLALPSVQKMVQLRPRTAVPTERKTVLNRPDTSAVWARREDNTEQFNDIMFNNVLRKQKVHRRVKSDVTTPDYVFPTHSPRTDEHRRSDKQAKDAPHRAEEQYNVMAPKRNSALNIPLSKGLLLPDTQLQQQQYEIVLRGVGHHGDGELLPHQRRKGWDTAQNIISGQT